jgi:hypothetical protein
MPCRKALIGQDATIDREPRVFRQRRLGLKTEVRNAAVRVDRALAARYPQ